MRAVLSLLLLGLVPTLLVAQAEITLISAVQGPGSTSPIEGQTVTIEAMVTATFFDVDDDCPGLDGFFVQEEPEDYDSGPGSELTSEGLFIFAPGADSIVPGRSVQVTGVVTEYETSGGASSLTELARVSNITKRAAIVQPPFDVLAALPVDAVDSNRLERFEGMLVQLTGWRVHDNYDLSQFGSLRVGAGDNVIATEQTLPGPSAFESDVDNRRRQLIVDDRSTARYPTSPLRACEEEWTPIDVYRRDWTIEVQGAIVDDRFGAYRLQSTVETPTIFRYPQGRPLRPEVPRIGRDTGETPITRIAGANVGNFFLTLDDGADDCGPGQSIGCRGARTEVEFDRQFRKLMAAIIRMDLDILGLVEIENTPGIAPLARIVDSLNIEAGSDIYDYIRTGVVGGDAIRNGIIYRSEIVEPVGEAAVLDGSVDPEFFANNRPSIAQAFRRIDDNAMVSVVVNHLKSKGSDCERFSDTNQLDGQGNCNGVRTLAAAALKRWVATDPTGSGDPDYVLLGDFNSYAMEDPIRRLTHGEDGMSGGSDDYDHQQVASPEEQYTYVFDGLQGTLDYALTSSSLRDQVAGFAIWHTNADESPISDYRTDPKPIEQQAIWRPEPYRYSDHDPVMIGLRLRSDRVGVEEQEPSRIDRLDLTGRVRLPRSVAR